MKKYIYFFLITLFLGSNSGYAQTTLAAGDMAIIGVNSDLATTTEISLAALVPIASNTTIFISDFFWDATNSRWGNDGNNGTTQNNAEGIISWTTTAAITAGSVFTISIAHGSPSMVTGLPGTVSVIGTGHWNLDATVGGGDNWFIYQGTSTAPSRWIFGFTNWSTNNAGGAYGWGPAGSTAISATVSNLPTGLTNGSTALALTGNTTTTPNQHNPHYDNIIYTGTKTGLKTVILAAICTASNWIGDEITTYNITSGGAYFPGTIPFTITSPCACDPACSQIPTAAGTYTATTKNAIGTYTHYCDGAGKLLLSVLTPTNGTAIPAAAVKVKVGASTVTSYTQNCGGTTPTNACFMSLANNGLINRFWHIDSTLVTGPVVNVTAQLQIISYFTPQEYTNLNTLLSNTLTGVTNLRLYQPFVKYNFGAFPDPSLIKPSNAIKKFANGVSVTSSLWKYTATLAGIHSAEFRVSSLGNSGGIGKFY
jgi:hypothetical protein